MVGDTPYTTMLIAMTIKLMPRSTKLGNTAATGIESLEK